MPLYRVTIIERTTEAVVFEVEAPSSQDAEEILFESMTDGTRDELQKASEVRENDYDVVEVALID